MFDETLYDQTQNLQIAMFQAAHKVYLEGLTEEERANQASPLILLQLRAGYAESPRWLMVQAAEFDPEPLTVKGLRVRAIWSSESIIQAMLELMASEKWLERVGDSYSLTDEGYAVIRRRLDGIAQVLSCLDGPDFSRLEGLIRPVIDASLQSDDPPGTWCLRYSRRRAPDDNASTVLKVFQYLSDFNAIRDDAHMASFREHNLEGYIWESFSFICKEMASNADSLFEQLAYRGYSRQDYASALHELERRGWIKSHLDGYQATDQGRAVRDRAEALTDEYFYAPWSVLNDEERTELQNLIADLHRQLNSGQ